MKQDKYIILKMELKQEGNTGRHRRVSSFGRGTRFLSTRLYGRE